MQMPPFKFVLFVTTLVAVVSIVTVKTGAQFQQDASIKSDSYVAFSRAPASSAVSSSRPVFSSSSASIADLSVILDSNITRAAANGNVVFSTKVKNVGTMATSAKVMLFAGDMTYVSTNGGCGYSSGDSTVIDCNINVGINSSATLTVTLKMPANFTCANSMNGRSVFATVVSADAYSQNDVSNIINILPVCP